MVSNGGARAQHPGEKVPRLLVARLGEPALPWTLTSLLSPFNSCILLPQSFSWRDLRRLASSRSLTVYSSS